MRLRVYSQMKAKRVGRKQNFYRADAELGEVWMSLVSLLLYFLVDYGSFHLYVDISLLCRKIVFRSRTPGEVYGI